MSIAERTLHFQRERTNLFREWLDFFRAAITTGQRAPWRPITIFGWTP